MRWLTVGEILGEVGLWSGVLAGGFEMADRAGVLPARLNPANYDIVFTDHEFGAALYSNPSPLRIRFNKGVETVNGRLPINSEWAGKEYPLPAKLQQKVGVKGIRFNN